MFYDPNDFLFVKALQQNWENIYEEYLRISDQTISWPERELCGEGWQVFGLFDFPHGKSILGNIEKCPVTTAIIQDYMPNHGAVGFSVLQPYTQIKAHQGYQGNYLRCHLGLQIPLGDCAIMVGCEKQSWKAGQLLIFDDRITHCAWNLTNKKRVILLIDFIPDPATLC